MIAIEKQDNIVVARVLGEFALADFREFEEMVSGATAPPGTRLSLLFDLREMAGFTVDLAWEEIKFSRAHGHDFGKVAVLTGSQWVAWSAWLTRAIGDVELDVFEDESEARAWLAA